MGDLEEKIEELEREIEFLNGIHERVRGRAEAAIVNLYKDISELQNMFYDLQSRVKELDNRYDYNSDYVWTTMRPGDSL